MPLITSLIIVGGGITVAAFTARGEKRRRIGVLRTVSERHHGSLDLGGLFGNPQLHLRFGDGIEIRVSMWSTKNERYTEYKAIVPAPGLPVCKVAPTGFTGWVGKVLGAQDIEVGHAAFDDAFTVKGDDPGVVRRLWPKLRAQDMAYVFASCQFQCDLSTIKLIQPLIATVEQAELAIELILDVARCDPYGLNVLTDLPEASLRHGDRFLQVELPGPTRIMLGPIDTDGIVRTCARTASIGGTVPADAETLVTAQGATLEQTEHELRIWWPSVESDPRRLTAAIDILRHLAGGPSLGVFR